MQSKRNYRLLRSTPLFFHYSLLLLGLCGLFAENNPSGNVELSIIAPSRSLICKGDTIHLLAMVSDNDTPVFWTPNDGSYTSLSDSSIVAMPQQDTWYYASTTGNACTAMDSVFIEVQEVIIEIDPVAGRCAGAPFTLIARANIEGEFSWLPTNIIGEDLIGDTVMVNARDTTIYTASIQAECGIVTGEILVEAAENPAINIFCFNLNTENPIIVEGQETNIFVLPNNTDGAQFVWADGETETQRTVHPEFPSSSYMVTVTYPNGCTRAAQKDIQTIPDALLANAFVPDGNKEQDAFFHPILNDVALSVKSFQIYNRWGQLVYNNDTPDTGWNGSIDGKPAASDVYLYHLILTHSDGEDFAFRGNVTLIR